MRLFKNVHTLECTSTDGMKKKQEALPGQGVKKGCKWFKNVHTIEYTLTDGMKK